MKQILNLADPTASNIDYKISKFPDGQQTVDLIGDYSGENLTNVVIYSRLNSFRDLELIICATQAIRNLSDCTIALYVPYFLGARSDRKFQIGGVNYLKQVICPIINSQNYSAVLVLDPHSDVLEACLNRFEKLNNHLIVKYSLQDLHGDDYSNVAIVSPDAGALKKIYDVAKEYGIEKVVTAGKVRDIKTSKILKTELPQTDWTGIGIETVMIIDDICDGGRTFTELAKSIRESGFTGKIVLIVTHGIFSAGLKPLNEHFDHIYTTNSVIDKNDPDFQIKNVYEMDKLTQFNVL
jgi:ribose-phosphate pyrophosphokinase